MIYLQLFVTFFKVGLFSFGGGMGMMQIIEQEVVTSHGWLSTDMLYNFIAVSESTPGPIAINIATFIGTSQGGFLGGMCATIGVVLPSFLIILIISKIFQAFSKNLYVKEAVAGMSQIIYGLLLSFAVLMVFKNLIVNYGDWNTVWSFDYLTLPITAILLIIYFGYEKIRKKKLSPIILIVISAGLGMLFYL